MKEYMINEIFYSLQGEGGRAGEASVFIRFSGCNLTCTRDSDVGGFDCDTEFTSGRRMSAAHIEDECRRLAPEGEWVVYTGGEPSLQLDEGLIEHMRTRGWKQAIETNGTKPLPAGLDWITVSPKTAEHTLQQLIATEVKYVRHYGQGIPKSRCAAIAYYISPAFESDRALTVQNIKWCIDLVKENPKWRLSVQQHKLWGVR